MNFPFSTRRMQGLILTFSMACLSCCPALAQASSDTPSSQDPSTAQVPTEPSAQQGAFPGRLSDVEGAVRIAQQPSALQNQPQGTAVTEASAGQLPPPPPTDESFRDALVNMPVLSGMAIETGDDGRAEIQFNDGSLVRLTPNSTLEIVVIDNTGERLHAVRGLSYYELSGQGGGGVLTVQVGPDEVRAAPGSLVRVDQDNAPFQVAVLRGSAHFSDAGMNIRFETPAGQTAILDPSAPTAYDVRQDLASNSWDQWNSDRDGALAELAENQTNARVGNGDSSSEAWNDLDYYGTWYNVPGAGMAWAPDGVDQNFDPYGQGAWGYYSGVGLTWISAYPWGWLPYRCGGWNHFDNFGWLWQPGGTCGGFAGGGWYPYSGVVHPPHGYRLPARPITLRLAPHQGILPRSLAFAPVRRGPSFEFRQVGGVRPEPRAFAVGKSGSGGDVASGEPPVYATTLPVTPTQLYRGQPGAGFVGGGSAFRGAPGTVPLGPGGGLHNQHIEHNHSTLTPGSAVSPAPRILPAPTRAIAPPPQPIAPPMHLAPAPMPHLAAPAARAH